MKKLVREHAFKVGQRVMFMVPWEPQCPIARGVIGRVLPKGSGPRLLNVSFGGQDFVVHHSRLRRDA